ncbi:MAG TPA: hypothetical protein PKN44_16470 [Bacteroidales bacterium]|nr:hypothetical protein [Bacteroidales bacterium]
MATFIKKLLTVLSLLTVSLPGFSQVVYEDINNSGIYEFLDELANLKIIMLNSTIKPYSRELIATKLLEAEAFMNGDTAFNKITRKSNYKLNKRQQKELHFYLQDFQLERKKIRNPKSEIRNPEDSSRITRHALRMADEYDYKLSFLLKSQPNMAVALNPLGFNYRDSLFTFSLRPILGFRWMTNENAAEYHRWWGGSMFGYVGKNVGFYANLRDNNESTGLEYPEYFTLQQGQMYKPGTKNGVDFSEMKAGISVSWNWGSFGLFKDRFVWGNNYHGSNIISGKAPSFPYIQLHLNPVKWFDFNYIHGWLNSEVVDSSRSYYTGNFYRTVYRNKYIAANMFTFFPWKGLNVSFGNSVVYSDDGIQPVFLIPFMFFNSVDATNSSENNNAGQNSQLFFDVSTRQIRYLHLWVSLYIDEMKFSRVFDPNSFNWTSWKIGFRLSDWPVRNLNFTGEWTKTNPITYKHYISTTTFASNDYCMGNYLRDNSREFYFSLAYKPVRGLHFNVSYTMAQHGDDYTDDRSYSYDILGFMKQKTWQNQALEVTVRYEFINNGYFLVRYVNSNSEGEVTYQPGFMHGKTNNLTAGVNIGF